MEDVAYPKGDIVPMLVVAVRHRLRIYFVDPSPQFVWSQVPVEVEVDGRPHPYSNDRFEMGIAAS